MGYYNYNFTDVSSKAYGGIFAQKEIDTGVWGMISGDGNNDNLINISDKNTVWKPQAGSFGYKKGDFNLNKQVDNKDKNYLWFYNNSKSSQVPSWLTCGDPLNDPRDGQILLHCSDRLPVLDG